MKENVLEQFSIITFFYLLDWFLIHSIPSISFKYFSQTASLKDNLLIKFFLKLFCLPYVAYLPFYWNTAAVYRWVCVCVMCSRMPSLAAEGIHTVKIYSLLKVYNNLRKRAGWLMDPSQPHVALCNVAFSAAAHAPVTSGFNSLDTLFPECEVCSTLTGLCPLKVKPSGNLLWGDINGSVV